MFSALKRKNGVTFGIHDINLGDSRITMFFGGLAMRLCSIAVARICGIAFNDGRTQFVDKRLDKSRVKLVRFVRLAGRHFHGNLTFCFTSESIVDFNKIFRSDILYVVYRRNLGGIGPGRLR